MPTPIGTLQLLATICLLQVIRGSCNNKKVAKRSQAEQIGTSDVMICLDTVNGYNSSFDCIKRSESWLASYNS